jgi:hypothetical protein
VFDLAAGHLVRREDGDHVGHAGSAGERLLGIGPFLADGGDHGPLGADDHVGLEA